MAEERLDDSADGTVGDVFQALAEHYAELWNDLHDAGMEPSDVGMAKVAAELDEGSWAVHHDDDTGKWVAVEVNDDEPAEGERLSYARAVSGGGKAPRVKGKSGVFTDKRGHKYKLENGRRVPMGDGKAAAPAKPSAKTTPAKPAAKAAGGAPKKTHPSAATKTPATPATEKAAKKPAAAKSYAEQVKAKAAKSDNQTKQFIDAVQYILDNRRAVDFHEIGKVTEELKKLPLADVKKVSDKFGISGATARSRSELADSLKNALESIKGSAEQSSFSLSGGDGQPIPARKDPDVLASFLDGVFQEKSAKGGHLTADDAVAKINHFLDNRKDYSYDQIDGILTSLHDVSMEDLEAVGKRLEGPVKAESKGALIQGWRDWLHSIKLASDQSQFEGDEPPAKKSANDNPPAKGTLAKAVSKAEEVTDAVADKVEAVADFMSTPISEVPARLRDMFRKAPEDPSAVMKEAEKAKTLIEAAMKAGLAAPADQKKVEKIVESNQQTLMAKLGGLAAGVAVRTAKVVGGLGLIGIGAGLGAMGGVAAATNSALFAVGCFDSILDKSAELMAHGAGMVSGKSDNDGESAKPKRYARDAADDTSPGAATEPESFGETLPMSVIRKLAVDYHAGVIEDLQAEFGAGDGDKKATEPTLFDNVKE